MEDSLTCVLLLIVFGGTALWYIYKHYAGEEGGYDDGYYNPNQGYRDYSDDDNSGSIWNRSDGGSSGSSGSSSSSERPSYNSSYVQSRSSFGGSSSSSGSSKSSGSRSTGSSRSSKGSVGSRGGKK